MPYSYVSPYNGVPFKDSNLCARQKILVNKFRQRKKYGWAAEVVCLTYLARKSMKKPAVTRDDELMIAKAELETILHPDSKQLHTCTVSMLATVYEEIVDLWAVGQGWYLVRTPLERQRVIDRSCTMMRGWLKPAARADAQMTRPGRHRPRSALDKRVYDDVHGPLVTIYESLQDVAENAKLRKTIQQQTRLLDRIAGGARVAPAGMPVQQLMAQATALLAWAKKKLVTNKNDYIGRLYPILPPRGTYDAQELHVGPFWTWYTGYLASPEWAEVRRRVLQRYPRCAVCSQKATDVDHLVYLRVGHERWGDVQSLCSICHKQKHKR